MGAIFYDTLLTMALLLFAFLPIPFLPDAFRDSNIGNFLSQFYFVLVVYGYFTISWIRGGQTIGMKAWGIKLVATEKLQLNWVRVSVRFASACLSWACFCLGYAWILVDPERCAWHDYLSGTRIRFVKTPV